MKNTFLEEYKRRTLRQCQLKQLGILAEIDRICGRHGIRYWLDGGSLLGAVRELLGTGKLFGLTLMPEQYGA